MIRNSIWKLQCYWGNLPGCYIIQVGEELYPGAGGELISRIDRVGFSPKAEVIQIITTDSKSGAHIIERKVKNIFDYHLIKLPKGWYSLESLGMGTFIEFEQARLKFCKRLCKEDGKGLGKQIEYDTLFASVLYANSMNRTCMSKSNETFYIGVKKH